MEETLCTDYGMELIANAESSEWYMVEDSVWAEATKRWPATYLCIGCLEHRIGRKLTAHDFAPTLLNFLSGGSERIQDRMQGFEDLKMEEAVKRIGGEDAVKRFCKK